MTEKYHGLDEDKVGMAHAETQGALEGAAWDAARRDDGEAFAKYIDAIVALTVLGVAMGYIAVKT